MAPEIKFSPKGTQKLNLTQDMKLDLVILQLPLHKLKVLTTQQLEENPVLEQELNEELPADREEAKFDGYSEASHDEDNDQHRGISAPTTLGDHLLRQLSLFVPSPEQYKIGEFIIGNLDENGYLNSTVEDMAQATRANAAEVELMLFLIQTFDPIGVAARDLKECLSIQLRAKDLGHTLAFTLVQEHLETLEKRKYEGLAQTLSLPLEIVKEAVKEIGRLEPKPGRIFHSETTVHLIPDAIVKKNEDGYEIIMNTGDLPRLTLNETYRGMIKQKDTPSEAKEYLRERIKAARSLISSVNRRVETVRNVVEAIVAEQKGFLEAGVTALKPLTLDDIAKVTGNDKSTISRTVNNKYLQTPSGIVELSYFFHSQVKQDKEAGISSEAIKSKITDLISAENKAGPLSDQKIVDILQEGGITLSRRVVTKYRKQLNIPSSQLRKER